MQAEVGDERAVGRTVCGFANGDGGLIVSYVDDGGRVVEDGENPETVQERLASFLESGYGRRVTAECGRHKSEGGWVRGSTCIARSGYERFSCDGGC